MTDGGYDVTILQTVGRRGKFYEVPLIKVTDTALTDLVKKGLLTCASIALMPTPLAPVGVAATVIVAIDTGLELAEYLIEIPEDYFLSKRLWDSRNTN